MVLPPASALPNCFGPRNFWPSTNACCFFPGPPVVHIDWRRARKVHARKLRRGAEWASTGQRGCCKVARSCSLVFFCWKNAGFSCLEHWFIQNGIYTGCGTVSGAADWFGISAGWWWFHIILHMFTVFLTYAIGLADAPLDQRICWVETCWNSPPVQTPSLQIVVYCCAPRKIKKWQVQLVLTCQKSGNPNVGRVQKSRLLSSPSAWLLISRDVDGERERESS